MNTSVEICNGAGPVADVEVPIEPKGRHFRINAKKFLLTYNQAPKNFYPKQAIDQLLRNTGMKDAFTR